MKPTNNFNVNAMLWLLSPKHITMFGHKAQKIEKERNSDSGKNNKSYYDHANLWLEILMWKYFALNKMKSIFETKHFLYICAIRSNGVLHLFTSLQR